MKKRDCAVIVSMPWFNDLRNILQKMRISFPLHKVPKKTDASLKLNNSL